MRWRASLQYALSVVPALSGRPCRTNHARVSARCATMLRIVSLVSAVILLNRLACAQSGSNESNGTGATDWNASRATQTDTKGFWGRFFEAYRQDWKSNTANESETPRRIPPAPLTSPPFPNADRNYGGSATIGATNIAHVQDEDAEATRKARELLLLPQD